ncbi:hypothetical protein GGF46_004934 [Coemansia sp. RSA 552]|nr:hypothetical protein GGF46_004934 [Coemansia sp. RSA 552]
MHINKLPEDILLLIFRREISPHTCDLDGCVLSPLLVSVCKRWRQIALPLVYRRLWIAYDIRDYVRQISDNSSGGRALADPPDAVAVSNARTIAAFGHGHLVKHVDMVLDYLLNPLIGLEKSLSLLSDYVLAFPNINSVSFTTQRSIIMYDDSSLEALDIAGQLKRVVGEYARVMPGITRLQTRGIFMTGVITGFIGMLADTYAGQLTSILSGCALASVRESRPFTELARMHVMFDENSSQGLPVLTARPLRDLFLKAVPPEYAWTRFCQYDGPADIEFSNLHMLKVSYYDYGLRRAWPASDGHNYKLRFPQLQRLTIFDMEDYCPVIQQGEFPPELDYVDITATGEAVGQLCRVKLPKTKHLALEIGLCEAPLGTDVFTAANNASRAAQTSRITVIDISNMIANIPATFVCPALTHLHSNSMISPDMVLRLVQSLPNLSELSLSNIDALQTLGCAIEPDPKDVCSSIEVLSISFNYMDNMHLEVGIALAWSLLLRLPALQSFDAWQIPQAPIDRLAETHHVKYPHLRHISTRLQSDQLA